MALFLLPGGGACSRRGGRDARRTAAGTAALQNAAARHRESFPLCAFAGVQHPKLTATAGVARPSERIRAKT